MGIGRAAGATAPRARPHGRNGVIDIAPTPPGPPDAPRRRLARVLVSPERVVRTIVGLRPFRRSGFRVEAEPLGDTLLVHNYGHGGCGVTLSWGTASLAVDRIVESGRTRAGRGHRLRSGRPRHRAAASNPRVRGHDSCACAAARDDLERGRRALVSASHRR